MSVREQFLIDYTWAQNVVETCTHFVHTKASYKLIGILKDKYYNKLDSEYLNLFILELYRKWQLKEQQVLN